LNQNRNRNWS
jgi:hypothetical protein